MRLLVRRYRAALRCRWPRQLVPLPTYTVKFPKKWRLLCSLSRLRLLAFSGLRYLAVADIFGRVSATVFCLSFLTALPGIS